jgi:chromosome segregation ATPase
LSHIVDIDLKFGTSNTQALDKLMGNLEKIQKLANVKVDGGSTASEEIKKKTNDLKLQTQQYKIEGELLKANHKHHQNAVTLAEQHLQKLERRKLLNSAELEHLRLKNTQDMVGLANAKQKENAQKAEQLRFQQQITASEQLQRQREQALRSHEMTRMTLQEQLEIIKRMQTQYGGQTGTQYTRLNSELARYNTQLQQNVGLTNQQARSLDRMVASANNTVQATQQMNMAFRTFAGMMGARVVLGSYKELNNELKTLDTSIYNLGVVADFSVSKIERLRTEMLQLAKGFPQSAKELADSADLIARTGLSFEDSIKIVQASAKLATSSGKMFA